MFIKVFTLILLINVFASCFSYGINLVNNNSLFLLNNTTFVNEKFILEGISGKIILNDEFKISDNEKEYIKTLGQKILKSNVPLKFTNAKGISPKCHKEYRLLIKSLEKMELWALNLHDANAKISSGILHGNVNNFGNFDQCVNVMAPNEEFQGKYCLAELQPSVPKNSPHLKHLKSLAQSYEIIQSNFNDPAHIFARFSSVNWAVCVPSSCSSNDIKIALMDKLTSFTNGTGIKFDLLLNSERCQIKTLPVMDKSSKITILFFVIIFTTSILSTLYEHVYNNDSWMTSFSIMKNSRELFLIKSNPNDIQTVHSIRFISAILIFLSHKCGELHKPMVNGIEMAMNSGRSESVFVRICALYTDTFLLLSGMLVSYSFIGKLQQGQRINIIKEYAARYMRITPSIVAIILFGTFIIPLLGSGPLWSSIVIHPATLCKNYWWRNLLFIHNWYRFEDMCMLHTHHVGTDFELFLIAPFIIYILFKWPKKGTILIFALAAISTIARLYITYTKELAYFIPFGVKLSQLVDTATFMYSRPPYRFTVYAIGIMLGYYLRKHKNTKLSKLQLSTGWSVCILSYLAVIVGSMSMIGMDYKYNSTHAALFAAFAPILWCFHSVWIIFASHLGYDNSFTETLQWKGFQITSKFSYAFYLVQILVLQLNIAGTRTTEQYGTHSMINLNELFFVVLATIALALFFEVPFTNIKKLIFDKTLLTKLNSETQLTKKIK